MDIDERLLSEIRDRISNSFELRELSISRTVQGDSDSITSSFNFRIVPESRNLVKGEENLSALVLAFNTESMVLEQAMACNVLNPDQYKERKKLLSRNYSIIMTGLLKKMENKKT
jgi:hypothetical protein